MPDAFIGVDVMVGCRGEKPELFEECRDFLQSLDVTQLHVFPYSERPGTMALKIPYIVDEAEKKRRSKQLIDMSEEKRIAFYEKYIREGCQGQGYAWFHRQLCARGAFGNQGSRGI